jgi:Xaa-Pro aminopeptidase
VKSGLRENSLAAEIEYQMRRLGAEKPSFETIVAAGPRSALPHAQPSEEALENDQLLLIDMGAVLEGYSSDMTRMVHLGKAGKKVQNLYYAVLEAQLTAIEFVRAGVRASQVDATARKVLRRYGYDKLFVHSLGHGVGLEIHEGPRIGRRDESVLEPGMVITIEPGAYIQGFGGVRIEDMVLVTASGCENLTPTPKELLIA